MKYLVCLLFTFLLIQNSGLAQANYKPGVVVTLKGDTLRGFINYKEWEENPEVFSFKTALSDTETNEFTPVTTKYFEITGLEAYVRYEGEISADRVDIGNIPTRLSNKKRSVLVFLRLIQDGPNVKLLSFKDILKVRYFIQEKDVALPVELVFKRVMTDKNQIADIRSYTLQLLKVAEKLNKATDSFKQELEDSRYSGRDLLRLISTLNNISFEQVRKNEKRNHQMIWFAGAGLNNSVTKAYGVGSVNQEIKGSTLPKIYFGFDTFLNPQVQKFVFRCEGSVTLANQKAELIYSARSRTLLKFNAVIVSFAPQVLYNIYNSENFKWYIGGGVSTNYYNYLQYEFSEYQTSLEDGVERVSYLRDHDKYHLTISFPVRTGIIINKKLDAGLQYFRRSLIASNSLFSISSLNLQVGYAFNQK